MSRTEKPELWYHQMATPKHTTVAAGKGTGKGGAAGTANMGGDDIGANCGLFPRWFAMMLGHKGTLQPTRRP